MYGLVNQAIEELVIQTAGPEAWEQVKRRAGIDEPSFINMKAYPDEMTYALVGATSETLDVDADEILRSFGRHWILFTAAEGYGALLDMAGDSLPEFLSNLDGLHARLGMSMSELRPPSFRLREHDPNVWELEYISDRSGLAPMVIGLLEGLGERFGCSLKIEAHVEAERTWFRIEALPDRGE